MRRRPLRLRTHLLAALLMASGLAGCIPRVRRYRVISIAHYFCLVQVAALIGLLRGLTGRQSVLWRRFERVQAPSIEAAQ